MKTFAIAALAGASVNAAFNAEFIKGAQSGIFLKSEDQIEDFQCQPALVDPKIQQILAMAPAMEMMMNGMSKGAKPSPMIDVALELAESFGKVIFLFADDFEQSDFCKGLLFSTEASKVVMELGQMAVTKQSETYLQ